MNKYKNSIFVILTTMLLTFSSTSFAKSGDWFYFTSESVGYGNIKGSHLFVSGLHYHTKDVDLMQVKFINRLKNDYRRYADNDPYHVLDPMVAWSWKNLTKSESRRLAAIEAYRNRGYEIHYLDNIAQD